MKVMGQANAVGPTAIEGSFFVVINHTWHCATNF